MEDITDNDYKHANKVFKEFKLKHLVQKTMICMCKAIHYYFQMYLKILETCVLKYIN